MIILGLFYNGNTYSLKKIKGRVFSAVLYKTSLSYV